MNRTKHAICGWCSDLFVILTMKDNIFLYVQILTEDEIVRLMRFLDTLAVSSKNFFYRYERNHAYQVIATAYCKGQWWIAITQKIRVTMVIQQQMHNTASILQKKTQNNKLCKCLSICDNYFVLKQGIFYHHSRKTRLDSLFHNLW